MTEKTYLCRQFAGGIKNTVMTKINVIIVDDLMITRLGMKAILEKEKDIRIAALVESGEQLLAKLKTTPADVVLLDIIMPGLGGIETARRLRSDYPAVKILVLSSENSSNTIRELTEIGIEGFISKQKGGEDDELAKAIRAVACGLEYFGKDITEIIYSIYVAKKQTEQPILTNMELKIINLCREGLSSKLVADRLHIAVRTVDTHKTNIFRKLGINNTLEMVNYALKTGII